MPGEVVRKRALGIEDYLAIAKRRIGLIVIPAILGPMVALAGSFLLTPKYTSQSLLQVEGQVVPPGYVKPIVTEHVSDRMTVLQQRVLSHSHLQNLVERLGLAAHGTNPEAIIEEIRANVSVTPAYPGSTSKSSAPSLLRRINSGDSDDVPGFFVSFTSDNPRTAQLVCAEITSLLLDENLKRRQETAHATTEFLGRQLDEAKETLDRLDNRLAEFKKLHLGRLPSDVDNNLKILSGLDSQLDANTQILSRAEQDESFAEALLAQELAAWRASRLSPNLPSLREELITLKDQLISLQSRYTSDHPDVLKTKSDIARVEAELKELGANANSAAPPDNDQARIEPEHVLRLRHQIHEDEGAIARATQEHTRLTTLIDSYRSRLALSPDVEEQYKQLTRDSETAHAIYDGLLTDKNKAEMQAELEHEQQGEQVKLLDAANLPDSPSFPIRWMFALGGVAAGLALGLGLVLLFEVRDKSIRTESDVIEVLDLPMLASMPWAHSSGNEANGGHGPRDRIGPLVAR
jgi:uncharacterized protein involved in exopolysaccharide biosynthesis